MVDSPRPEDYVRPMTLEDVVNTELCIGCGLCRSKLGGDAVGTQIIENGLAIPVLKRPMTPGEERDFQTYCPGAVISAPEPDGLAPFDPVWGNLHQSIVGHAKDPEVRFQGTSGGVLSAICAYALDEGLVDYIYHIAPDPQNALGSHIVRSRSRADLFEAMGSRYTPTSPLEAFDAALAEGIPFGFVGKPCDVMAVRNLSKIDPRVDEFCKFTLSFACGGTSELPKTLEVLASWGVAADELESFTWRGPGCPGPIRGETRDGRSYEMTLEEFYEGAESNWRYVFRCKMCPDGIGLSADIAGADYWEDCMPEGEDPGFNTIVARTPKGSDLLDAAISASYVTSLEPIPPQRLSETQPHHVRKRIAMKARMQGLCDATGTRPFLGDGLCLDALSNAPDSKAYEQDRLGTAARIGALQDDGQP